MTKMPLRDSDLRQAAHEDGIRPGDRACSLLREFQERRDEDDDRRWPRREPRKS